MSGSSDHAAIARLATSLVFLVASIPSFVIVLAVHSGALGMAPGNRMIVMAFAIIVFLAAMIGYLLQKALTAVDAHPGRTRADAWVAFYVTVTVVIVGAAAAPNLLVVAMVKSDRSLSSHGVWFFFWWLTAHTLVGVIAYGLGRLAFGKS